MSQEKDRKSAPRQNSPLLSALALTKKSWMPFMISIVRWKRPVPGRSPLPPAFPPPAPGAGQGENRLLPGGLFFHWRLPDHPAVDGTTLWVNWLGGHYLGYRPTDPAGFEAAIQRLALEYGGTAIVTS